MKLSGNTILVTGGGSGIGRGLAEALHKLGNEVIIAGRRKTFLAETAAANPGMQTLTLDVADAASIAEAVPELIGRYPRLNVLINSAGIQRLDDPANAINDDDLVSTVATNFLGPVRLTAALIDHLKGQQFAAIAHVTSMLGYLPHAKLAIYSATKAALHSYILSQRYALRGTSVAVLEISPPYVQTELGNGANDPRAMPLQTYISETMEILAGEEDDILIESAKRRRDSLRNDENGAMTKFNDMMPNI